jgi:hypothetical protein
VIRIYVDSNMQDDDGRLLLDNLRSVADLRKHEGSLKEGLRVMLYEDDDYEVEGTLYFDNGWLAVPDDSTLRYLDGTEL